MLVLPTLGPDLARLAVIGCPAVAPVHVGVLEHSILVKDVVRKSSVAHCACCFLWSRRVSGLGCC